MRLSWNEVRARAAAFAEDWKDAAYEKGETQSFYNAFFEVFRVQRRTFRDRDPANIEAAELVGRLHDVLADAGHRGHDLERFLVRIRPLTVWWTGSTGGLASPPSVSASSICSCSTRRCKLRSNSRYGASRNDGGELRHRGAILGEVGG